MQKPRRATVAQARRYVKAKGYLLDGPSTVVWEELEEKNGRMVSYRMSVKEFCTQRMNEILKYDDFRKKQRKEQLRGAKQQPVKPVQADLTKKR